MKLKAVISRKVVIAGRDHQDASSPHTDGQAVRSPDEDLQPVQFTAIANDLKR